MSRRRRDVQRELSRLTDVVALFDDQPPDPDTGAALTYDSLRRRHEQLVQELQAAAAGDLQVVLDGDAVIDGGADVEQVVRTLGPLQRAIASVGQALEGEATRAGAIASHITQRTRLRLVGTFAGSFGMHLAAPPPEDMQLEFLDDQVPVPLMEQSVATVLDVISAASSADDPEQAIVDQVADLGQRASGAIIELSEAVLRTSAPTLLIWRAPEEANDRVVSFDGGMAERLKSVLSITQTTERSIPVHGILGAADKFSRTFKILMDDGEVLSGRVEPDLVERLREYFDREVTATVLERTSRITASGKEATRYTLTAFVAELDA